MNESSRAHKMSLSVDFRWISLGLLAVVVVMLAMWKPWAAKATDRTIEVSGQATVSAKPDEFVFYPTYEFTDSDKKVALSKMSAKSSEVVTQLKTLGVADKDIKTNSDSWSYPSVQIRDGGGSSSVYNLRLTITTHAEALTQKVQDYLVTTTPSGTISPQATFSKTKLKSLEAQGRDEATKEARKKAEQSATNLGFRLSSVKKVDDNSGFGGYYPTDLKAMDAASSPSLTVQPGENDVTYTVTVTYYIR
jgi:uncharacterized protein